MQKILRHDVIPKYGTHYAYAVTYGRVGTMTTKLVESDVLNLHKNGVVLSTGAKAGFNFPTEAGSVGVSGGANPGSEYSKMTKHTKIG